MEERSQCNQCRSKKLTDDNGYVLCSDCGFVIETIISDAAEWTNQTGEADKSRCGSVVENENPFMEQLSTYVPKGSKSYVLRDNKYVYADIANLHIRHNSNSKQKSYECISSILENLGENYPIGIINTAKKLWAEIIKTNRINRSGPRKGLIVACVYYSCVHNNSPRTSDEVCKDLGFSSKDYTKGLKIFIDIFKNTEWASVLKKDTDISNFFYRYAYIIEKNKYVEEGTSFKLASKCVDRLSRIDQNELNYLTPKSIVCGILYVVCLENDVCVNKSFISKKLGICIPTLTKVIGIILK